MEEIDLTQICKKKRRSLSMESYSSNLNSEYESTERESTNSSDEIKEQTIKNIFSCVNDCAIDLRKRETNDVIRMKDIVHESVPNSNQLNKVNLIQTKKFPTLKDFEMLQKNAEIQLNDHSLDDQLNKPFTNPLNVHLNDQQNTQTITLDSQRNSHLYNPYISQFISTSNPINHQSSIELRNNLQFTNFYSNSANYLKNHLNYSTHLTNSLITDPILPNSLPIIDSSIKTYTMNGFDSLINLQNPTNLILSNEYNQNFYKMGINKTNESSDLVINNDLIKDQQTLANKSDLNEDNTIDSTNAGYKPNEVDLLKMRDNLMIISPTSTLSSVNENLEEVDCQNKMEYKRERNRQAARRCREKKLDRIKTLKISKEKVENEIRFLRKQVDILRSSNRQLSHEFMKHIKCGCKVISD